MALVAAVLLFRWEPGARAQIGRRGWWLVLVAAMWLALVGLAHSRARPVPAPPDRAAAGLVADYVRGVGAQALPRKKLPVAQNHPQPLPPDQVRDGLQAGGGAVVPVPQPVPELPQELPAPDLDAIAFERLPPDAGLVAPIANDQPDAVLERPLPLLVGAQADLPALCLPAHTGTEGPVRGRMMLYAFKLLGRVTGRRVGDPA